MRVLIVDNHDSFVHNIAQYVGSLGVEPIVKKSTEIDLDYAKSLDPERIIISPGPCAPDDVRYFGVSTELIKVLGRSIDTLGICLGHQGIAYAYGARVVRAKRIMHGKTSKIYHDGKSIYKGIKNPIVAARYHSLIVEKETLPEELIVTAQTEEEEVMGIRHTFYPIEGLQFHPESIMTEQGMNIIENFLDNGVKV
ncbi:MAG: aminodeoxychorismate/anthranilate synthase component II [Conexivisphaerales archaeon]